MDGGVTNPILLRRLSDWRNDAAWSEFVGRYEPLVLASCRSYGLNHDETADLCQRVWLELARRMISYRYDPTRSFRGWLRTLCKSRVLDLLRARRTGRFEMLRDDTSIAAKYDSREGDCESGERPRLLVAGQKAHDAVKSRVGEQTWRAFWAIAVEDWSVGETAATLGMSYAAAFAAKKRVANMLREEGQRLEAEGADPRR